MVPFQIAAEGMHRDVLPAVPGYLDVNLPSLKATLTRKPEAEKSVQSTSVRRRILFALIWIFYQQGHAEKARGFALRVFVVPAVSRRSRRRRWPRRWT